MDSCQQPWKFEHSGGPELAVTATSASSIDSKQPDPESFQLDNKVSSFTAGSLRYLATLQD